MTKKRIFLMTIPASGHLNPMCGLTHELCKQPDVECEIYSIEEFRVKIEKTGAKFRLMKGLAQVLSHYMSDEMKKQNFFSIFMNCSIDSAHAVLDQLVREIETERPDLVIYDPSFYPAKCMLEILKKKKVPMKYAEFVPNFVMDQEMMKGMDQGNKKDLSLLGALMSSFFRQIGLSWKFGIPSYNPFYLMTPNKENMKIVAVFPELQPRLEFFDSTHRFVGQCVSEEARTHEIIDDPELKSLLDSFPIRDQNSGLPEPADDDPRLIYMSLGTLFHHYVYVFEMFIKSFNNYNRTSGRKFKSSQFRLVMSVGDKSLGTINRKMANGELVVPKNILIRERVPQLEILKRAHLFITHSGMNSTSETIKFAVPIVSVPIEGDQHINAKRMCDELQLGVRLEAQKLNEDVIVDAIESVLGDGKYAKNIREMSKVSAKYNGRVDGAKHILDYLNSN